MFLPVLVRSPELRAFHARHHAQDALRLLQFYRLALARGDHVGAQALLSLAERYAAIAALAR